MDLQIPPAPQLKAMAGEKDAEVLVILKKNITIPNQGEDEKKLSSVKKN